jgi:hypothetical protein
MMRHRVVTCVTLLALSTAACDSSGREVIVIPRPADSVRVIGPTADELASAPAIQLVGQMRIDGDGTETRFSYIRAIDLSHTGEIFVLESQSSSVFVFDASGQAVRTIGGAGDGPGELRSPAHMAIGGDTLFVVDRNGINRFMVDGRWVSRTPVKSGGSNYTLFPQSLEYTNAGLVTSFPSHPGPRDSPYTDSTSLHHLSPATGEVSEPVAHVVKAHRYKIVSGMEMLPLFMPPARHVALSDGRILLTRQDGEHVDILSSEGALESRLRMPAPRRNVSDADVDALIAAVTSEMADMGHDFDVRGLERALESHPRAEFVPVVGRIRGSDEGMFLIERLDLSPGQVPGSAHPSTWDLLSPDGTILGRLELPARFTPHVVNDGRIIGVQRDDADVPSVILYQMIVPAR